MADKDKWFGAGLFVIGTLLVTGGVALEAMGSLVPPFAVAIAISGFVSCGLATALIIRWGTGTVTAQRIGAVVGVFVGVGVVTLGNLYLDGAVQIVTMGVGVILIGVAVYWNKRLVAQKDVVTRDERVDLLSYKATWRSWQALILSLAGWSFMRHLTSVRVPVDDVIIGLLLVGIVSRFGFYRYYTHHQ